MPIRKPRHNRIGCPNRVNNTMDPGTSVRVGKSENHWALPARGDGLHKSLDNGQASSSSSSSSSSKQVSSTKISKQQNRNSWPPVVACSYCMLLPVAYQCGYFPFLVNITCCFLVLLVPAWHLALLLLRVFVRCAMCGCVSGQSHITKNLAWVTLA